MGSPLRRVARTGLTALTLSVGCASFEAARLYSTGTDALEAGDTRSAVVRLEQAARLRPEASEVRNHLGLAYLQAGRVGEARSEFEQALALDCGNEAARQNLRALERAGGGP